MKWKITTVDNFGQHKRTHTVNAIDRFDAIGQIERTMWNEIVTGCIRI